MTYIEGADYFVRVVDLPYGVGGQVTTNDDGTFNVYLSARTGYDQQLDDYFHEYEHINNDDFYNEKPIKEVESRS